MEVPGMTAAEGNPSTGARHWLLPSIAAAGALLAAMLLYFVSPEREGAYPPCPFHYLTGLYCPGCGSMRAVARLLHGDVAGALGFNPFAVALMPYVVYECASEARRAIWGCGLPRLIRGRGIWALAAGVAAFFILRNVPIYPLTLLAP